MCYNCGCGDPKDSMGHEDNLYDKSIEKLAVFLGKDPGEMKHLIRDYLEGKEVKEKDAIEQAFDKAAKAWGQSIEEAKKNTLSLLKRE